jgi:hypothetical protein
MARKSYIGGHTLMSWHWLGHDGRISQKQTNAEKTRIKQGWDNHAKMHGLKSKPQIVQQADKNPLTREEITAIRKRIKERNKLCYKKNLG